MHYNWQSCGNMIFLMSLIAAISASCRKSDEEYKPALSTIVFIHASPGLEPIDFFIEGSRVNGDRTISYTDTLRCKFPPSGLQTFTVKRQISSISYVSKAYILKSNKHYSFFVAGRPDSVTHLVTEDKFIAPAAGKARLKFLNLSPDSKALDFKLMPSDTLFSNIPFKCGSDFVSVDPGKYTSGIYDKGGKIALANQSIEIEAGRFYTVWARGMKNSSVPATSLAVQMISVK